VPARVAWRPASAHRTPSSTARAFSLLPCRRPRGAPRRRAQTHSAQHGETGGRTARGGDEVVCRETWFLTRPTCASNAPCVLDMVSKVCRSALGRRGELVVDGGSADPRGDVAV
jgi:hypothetical protein